MVVPNISAILQGLIGEPAKILVSGWSAQEADWAKRNLLLVPERSLNGSTGTIWSNCVKQDFVPSLRVLLVRIKKANTRNYAAQLTRCARNVGWSFRVQDSIYAGCIPVFLADGTHYPYADVLDWSKFSVRLSPTDLDHVEDILAEIPLEKVEELQANLVAIREAFLYSTDDAPEEELNRKGPLFFALQSARIRLATRYPTVKGGEEAAIAT